MLIYLKRDTVQLYIIFLAKKIMSFLRKRKVLIVNIISTQTSTNMERVGIYTGVKMAETIQMTTI